MGYRYYTTGEIEQIIEMLKQGFTITKIAEVLNRDMTRLSKKIKELNLKVYKPKAECVVVGKPKRDELILIYNEKLKKVFENTFKTI